MNPPFSTNPYSPLFVSGCPRSGTSAVALWLSSHRAFSIGLERYQRYWANNQKLPPDALDERRFFDLQDGDTWYSSLEQFGALYDSIREKFSTSIYRGDKVPSFWRNFDSLKTMFPHAKFVHVHRNPMSIANSFKRRSANKDDPNWGSHRDVVAAIVEYNQSSKKVVELLSSNMRDSSDHEILLLSYEEFISGSLDERILSVFFGIDPVEFNQTNSLRSSTDESLSLLTEVDREIVFDLVDRRISLEFANLSQRQSIEIRSVVSARRPKRISVYHDSDRDILGAEYGEFSVPGSPVLFRGRGSDVDRTSKFAACLGSATTFGRFLKDPFPAQLERALQFPVVNLGIGGARPETFLCDEALMDFASSAHFVILEVMSARGYPSSIFCPATTTQNSGRLHQFLPSDSDYGADPLARRYYEIIQSKRSVFVDRAYEIAARFLTQSQKRDVSNMVFSRYAKDFLAICHRFKGRLLVVYLTTNEWMQARRCHDPTSESDWSANHPHFVDENLLELLKLNDIPIVTVRSRDGLPFTISRWDSDRPAQAFTWQTDPAKNTYYPSQEMHNLAARAILETEFMSRVAGHFENRP